MEASAVLGEDSLAVANNELAENLHSPILSLFVIRHFFILHRLMFLVYRFVLDLVFV